ncbi:hypothetical protein TgHK011_006480 [Trichoderma gracile]|nr:hypothetical protein TgHK011_006480 [Trichoderma gracile]
MMEDGRDTSPATRRPQIHTVDKGCTHAGYGGSKGQFTRKSHPSSAEIHSGDSDLSSKVPHTEYGGCTPYGPRAEHGVTGIQPGSGGVQPSGPTAGR